MSRIVRFEIHVDDPERAIDFYQTLFGWSFTQTMVEPIAYWLIDTGDESAAAINGGLMARPGGSGNKITAFICTIGVDDLDATLGKALSLGAQVALPRMHVPGIGHVAYVKDTEDNVLGLLQPHETTH